MDGTWVKTLGSVLGQGGPDGVMLGEAEYDQCIKGIIIDIKTSRASVLDVLRPLGGYLTSGDNVPRCRAISFLAEMIELAPETVKTNGDVHHLAEFFTARLSDWPAMHGALKGCHNIMVLSADSKHGLEIETQDVVQMIQTMNDGIYVRSLGVGDRSIAFKIMSRAIEMYGNEIINAEIDLAEMIIVSIDGEKDPRCLLDGFEAARCVLKLYRQLPPDNIYKETMENATEEMFDVLSCYFPVSFTPPPEDGNRITRDDIAIALQDTLLSWPNFGASLLELIEEKMSSIVKQAKLDSVRMLSCMAEAESYHEIICKEYRRIWNALRSEMLVGGLDAQMHVTQRDEDFRERVVECLGRCIQVCDVQQELGLRDEVLGDVSIRDAKECIRDPGSNDENFKRSIFSIQSASMLLKACSLSGGTAAKAVLKGIVPDYLSFLHEVNSVESKALCALLIYEFLQDFGSLKMDVVPLGNQEADVVRNIFNVCLSNEQYLGQAHVANGAEEDTCWNGDTFVWKDDIMCFDYSLYVRVSLYIIKAILTLPVEGILLENDIDRAMKCIIQMAVGGKGGCISQLSTTILTTLSKSERVAPFKLGLRSVLAALERIENSADMKDRKILCHLVSSLCSHEPEIALLTLGQILQSIRYRLNSEGESPALVTLPVSELIDLCIDIEHAMPIADCATATEVNILNEILKIKRRDVDESMDFEAMENGLMSLSFKIGCKMSIEQQQGVYDHMEESMIDMCHGNYSDYYTVYSLAGFVSSLRPIIVSQFLDNSDTLIQVAEISMQQSRVSRSVGVFLPLIVNKSDPVKHKGIIGKLMQIVQDQALKGNNLAFTLLSAICRAMAMKGTDLKHIILQVFQNIGALRLQEWSPFLQSLMSVNNEKWLVPEAHITVSPLWQQRLYMGSKQAYLEFQNNSENKDTIFQQIALANFLSGVPEPVIRSDAVFATQIICNVLARYQSDSATHELITSNMLEHILHTFLTLLRTEKSKTEVERQLPSVIPALLVISTRAELSLCRLAALSCLESLASLPYHVIHPYRKQVVKVTVDACDDRKRRVRLLASTCRQKWTAAA